MKGTKRGSTRGGTSPEDEDTKSIIDLSGSPASAEIETPTLTCTFHDIDGKHHESSPEDFMDGCNRAFSLQKTASTWLATVLLKIGFHHITDNIARVYPSASKEVGCVMDLRDNPDAPWPSGNDLSSKLLDLVIANVNRRINPLREASDKKYVILPFGGNGHWTLAIVCSNDEPEETYALFYDGFMKPSDKVPLHIAELCNYIILAARILSKIKLKRGQRLDKQMFKKHVDNGFKFFQVHMASDVVAQTDSSSCGVLALLHAKFLLLGIYSGAIADPRFNTAF